jgi:hypothetical protein
MLGENCSHLKHLYLKCNRLELCDLELKHDNLFSKYKLFTLESLYFHVRVHEYCKSILPLRVAQ